MVTAGRILVVILLSILVLTSLVSADDEYCAPPDIMATVIDHNGDWWNITIYSADCYTCEDVDGYGYVTCIPCDEPPAVSFISNATCGVIPFAVQFNDTSSNDPYAWNWSFGDGNYSSEQNPVHNYTYTGVFGINLSATNVINTSWYNISNYMLARPAGDSCAAIAPVGNVSVTVPTGKEPVPLKTEILPIPFLVIPLLCLVYIFRGHGDSEESNPVWGDVLAAGFGMVISAMVVIWFITGGITSVPVTVENASYEVPSSMSVADARLVQESVAQSIPIIGEQGSGMSITSAVSTAESVAGMTIMIRTHDTITQQYQDFGVAFLYMLLFVILVALFGGSLKFGIDQLREQDNDIDDPENWR